MTGIFHGIFGVVKFFFGLGALVTLLGIGLIFLWFVMHILVRFGLRSLPANRYPRLRQLFADPVT
jgi:hypothetical protein